MELAEKFAGGGTLLHRLDPRVKLIVAAVFSVLVAISDRLPPLLLALGFSLALVAFARLNVWQVIRRLAVPNTFVLLLWLTLPITVPGTPAAKIGPAVLSQEGIDRCLLVTLKVNAIVAALIALLNTSRILDLAHAARHLGVPDKLVMIFFFCVRYIHVIASEYRRLRDAMKVRAFKPRTNMHTYRTSANLLGMLLVRSHERAERIYAAMLCRGFRGKFNLLSHFKLKPVDCLAGFFMLCFVAVLGYFQWHPITF